MALPQIIQSMTDDYVVEEEDEDTVVRDDDGTRADQSTKI